MPSGILEAAGGLGLFLLGMSVMTEGLRAMADDRLKSVLARTTKGPVSGVCAGAVTTALLQSSSATTVAAVGFVHAGLLTFTQALGIIFGANTQAALRRMDTARWLRRLTHHAKRVVEHSQVHSITQVEKISAQPAETS